MSRNVKGSLFEDYVRMIRSRKDIEWPHLLPVRDMGFLTEHIEPNAWYPMEAFERLGNAILAAVAMGDLEAVRLWGYASMDKIAILHPELVAEGDPHETLMRFQVLRTTFFDFDALEVPMLVDGHAHIVLRFHMGPTAEEAACHQTLGFCEHLLASAGGTHVRAEFLERQWAGDPRTMFELEWQTPST